MARKPLLANDSIKIEHRASAGASDVVYTITLTGVSCHEAHGVRVSTPGFQQQATTEICIFPGFSQAATESPAEGSSTTDSTYLDPAAFKATESPRRAQYWTMDKEDIVYLPSGRKGRITNIEDNRAGRCPHWFVEVT